MAFTGKLAKVLLIYAGAANPPTRVFPVAAAAASRDAAQTMLLLNCMQLLMLP